MKEISLDELPLYSPWPERLLGSPRRRGTLRSREYVWREYNMKYEGLLTAYAAGEATDYHAIRQLEVGGATVAASMGKHLVALPRFKAMERAIEVLMGCLRPEAFLAGRVVDLGCGYGYLLSQMSVFPRLELRGGELVDAGRTLASLLDTNSRLGIEQFDFLSDVCWPLERMTFPAVVTTSYALHQLESARPAVELLARYREKIAAVVNLEPEEDHFGDGLLGLLRKRYGMVNGYSADLLRVLGERDDVTVDVVEPAIVGPNALLPATLTVWRFT